jgi:hypothetical protein
MLQWFQGLCGGYLFISGKFGWHSLQQFIPIPSCWQLVRRVGGAPSGKLFTTKSIDRHRDVKIHAAVYSEDQTSHWVSVPTIPKVSGIGDFSKESFRHKWWRDNTLHQRQPIQCSPLSQLLQKRMQLPCLTDFFKASISKALNSLRSYHLTNTVAFAIVIAEADEHNGLKNMAVRSLLESHGYVYLYDKERSQWFMNRNFHATYRSVVY